MSSKSIPDQSTAQMSSTLVGFGRRRPIPTVPCFPTTRCCSKNLSDKHRKVEVLSSSSWRFLWRCVVQLKSAGKCIRLFVQTRRCTYVHARNRQASHQRALILLLYPFAHQQKHHPSSIVHLISFISILRCDCRWSVWFVIFCS